MRDEAVLVVFGDKLPSRLKTRVRPEVVVAPRSLQRDIEKSGVRWEALEEFVGPGSVHEAGAMARDFVHLTLPNGSRLAKAGTYKGYELWWTHLTDLFLYFCLPYTQYKKLFEYLAGFQNVYLFQPPYANLFSSYLEAHGCNANVLLSGKRFPNLTAGIFLQALITLLSLPVLVARRHKLLVFTGDKFEQNRDHDFRLRYVYEELRRRKLPFTEFIRSPESWKTVLKHAWVRRRAAVYSEPIVVLARFLSIMTGGRRRAERLFGKNVVFGEVDPGKRFRLLVATQYLKTVDDDIWAIRIMNGIIRAIGIQAAVIVAANERNWHTVLACKLRNVPTVGILHGVNTHHFNLYDFLPGFDGEKMLSVDKYGLWSQWWKEYFLKCGSAYRPEQLYVSGPMRPLDAELNTLSSAPVPETPRVLFISEQVAAPIEVLPYLIELRKQFPDTLAIKFRPSRDGFERWLSENRPDLLKGIQIVRGPMQEALQAYDVVVGSHSTAVLEALFQFKVPIFFATHKWGDYFGLLEYGVEHPFFAESPQELVQKIRNVPAIPNKAVAELRERFFGDPTRNGSAWVVDQIESALTQAR